jgi:hypothetical protein
MPCDSVTSAPELVGGQQLHDVGHVILNASRRTTGKPGSAISVNVAMPTSVPRRRRRQSHTTLRLNLNAR